MFNFWMKKLWKWISWLQLYNFVKALPFLSYACNVYSVSLFLFHLRFARLQNDFNYQYIFPYIYNHFCDYFNFIAEIEQKSEVCDKGFHFPTHYTGPCRDCPNLLKASQWQFFPQCLLFASFFVAQRTFWEENCRTNLGACMLCLFTETLEFCNAFQPLKQLFSWILMFFFFFRGICNEIACRMNIVWICISMFVNTVCFLYYN